MLDAIAGIAGKAFLGDAGKSCLCAVLSASCSVEVV